MKLHKYISLNFFASLTYVSVILIIYIFFLEYYLIKYFPKAYITIEKCGEIYIILILLATIFMLLFVIEIFIRKNLPKLLPKINFKNKFLKSIHETLFIIGCGFTIFNLIIFVIIMISIFI